MPANQCRGDRWPPGQRAQPDAIAQCHHYCGIVNVGSTMRATFSL